MKGLLLALLMLLFSAFVLAQASAFAERDEALKGLSAPDPAQRAGAIAWIASNGVPSDDEALVQRLTDENPFVREIAERGLWVLWGRSGDDEIDALMAKGAEEMQERRFPAAIATLSEVIRRKPSFAEGWNRRATVFFLAGDLKRSLADCDEVMKRNPYHFGALAGYSQIYVHLEYYDRALDYARRALAVNPNLEGVRRSIEPLERLVEQRRSKTI